jgi:hypothetical protein
MARYFAGLMALLFILPSTVSNPAEQHKPVTAADVKAVVQAIEDEIYDHEYQGWDFGYVGTTVVQGEQRIRVYIRPTLDVDPNLRDRGSGYVIYKLMPFGEVYRLFSIENDGSAIVYGNPELGFTPERPNYLTVYMDDDELIHDKQTWLKADYDLQLHPSPERLRQASVREKKRTGDSMLANPKLRRFPPDHDPRCPVDSGRNR